MTHRYHPDPTRGDDKDAILWDSCEDCDSRTDLDGIQSLDNRNFARLWRKMLEVERDDTGTYLSWNERKAARSLYLMAILLERHTNIDPWAWPLK